MYFNHSINNDLLSIHYVLGLVPFVKVKVHDVKKNSLGLQAGTLQEKLLTIWNYSTKLLFKAEFGSSNYFTIPEESIIIIR